jgi:hypothetical protein
VNLNKTLLLITLLFLQLSVFAQQTVLKRELTFQVENERLEDVLLQLAEEGGFSFSYNSDFLPVDSLINLNVENSSVKVILNVLLGEELELKISGNHLVILKTRYSSEYSGGGASGQKNYTIDGYLQDNQTGEYIASATVYDVSRLRSATSDATGYFSLEIPVKEEVIGLAVLSDDYQDTAVVMLNGDQNLNIGMNPTGGLAPRGPGGDLGGGVGTGQVNKLKLTKLVASQDGIDRSGTRELNTTRFAQVSFIPFVGTNLKMSGVVENKVSINILGGYNGATNGLEFGGLFNITRYHAKGVQIAGLANVAGTETKGFQMAGIFNTNLGSVNGFQLAGINNLALDSLKGVQFSGVNNIVRGRTDGVQIAGINNLAMQDVDGLQFAGVTNVALKDINKGQFAGIANFGRNVKGGQFAGIFNTSYGKVSGGQFAGILNTSKTVKSLQLAGIMNVAIDSVEGAQITSILNFTRHNKGFQLALVNIADTVSGVSIGLINLVWKGYNKLEVHANEVLPLSARVKFGTKKFYNIVGFGTQGFAANNVWGYSYGFGGATRIGKKKSDLSFDLTFTDLQDNDTWFEEVNLNSRLSILYSYKIIKGISLFAGPTWSQLIYDPANLTPDSFLNDIPPYTMYSGKIGNWNVEGWIGFEFGVRLF